LINIEVAEHSLPRKLRTLLRVGVIALKLIKYEIAEHENEHKNEQAALSSHTLIIITSRLLSFVSFSLSLSLLNANQHTRVSRRVASGLCDWNLDPSTLKSQARVSASRKEATPSVAR